MPFLVFFGTQSAFNSSKDEKTYTGPQAWPQCPAPQGGCCRPPQTAFFLGARTRRNGVSLPQRACGVVHGHLKGRQLVIDALRHAVAANHHLVPRGHLARHGHRDGAAALRSATHCGLVNQRAQGGHACAPGQKGLGHVYRAGYAKAEARRFCPNNLHSLSSFCLRRRGTGCPALRHTVVFFIQALPLGKQKLFARAQLLRRCAPRPAPAFRPGWAGRTPRCTARTRAFCRLCR